MILLARKIIKIPGWYLPEKLTTFPNFTRFLLANAPILHNNCPKNIFPIFLGGGGKGHVPLPAPVSYAYVTEEAEEFIPSERDEWHGNQLVGGRVLYNNHVTPVGLNDLRQVRRRLAERHVDDVTVG